MRDPTLYKGEAFDVSEGIKPNCVQEDFAGEEERDEFIVSFNCIRIFTLFSLLCSFSGKVLSFQKNI